MVSTSGDNGSPSNRSLSTGVVRIVPLEMNLRARQVTLGPNISNAMGAKSTMLAAVSDSTSNGSLSCTHLKCGYFLAKSIDQMTRITLVMDDESVNVKSLKLGTYKDFRFADLKCQKKMVVYTLDSSIPMTSSAESIRIPGDDPWAAKQAGGASTTATAAVTVTVSFGRYDVTRLTSPAIFSIVNGCKATGLAYLGGSGGR
uniref:Uncharacterized protein n=1 Tax=Romanomermis culicivorax TaxID=13658 RepID=A0A915I5N6_ROMCU